MASFKYHSFAASQNTYMFIEKKKTACTERPSGHMPRWRFLSVVKKHNNPTLLEAKLICSSVFAASQMKWKKYDRGHIWSHHSPPVLTFKERTQPPPSSDTSLAGVLAECCLHEEHWDPTGEEEDEVGDEEGTYGFRNPCMIYRVRLSNHKVDFGRNL